MIELVGFCAVVVCCLKGRWLEGFILVAGGAAVMWMAYQVGVIAVAAGSVVLALPDPKPGSWWDRFHAVDMKGIRLLKQQPRPRRFRRAAVGVLLGAVPGAIGLSIADAVTSGDDALLFVGLASIGAILLGALVGGIIGFNWVPRDANLDRSG